MCTNFPPTNNSKPLTIPASKNMSGRNFVDPFPFYELKACARWAPTIVINGVIITPINGRK